jgi:hypothetical protein
MPKFKESLINFLEAHEFEMKKGNTEAVLNGDFVKLVISPTEEGYMATASDKYSGTEATAESNILVDAVVDCFTEFEATADSDSQNAVDELSDIADELEDDTGDYGYEDDYDEDEDDDYDDEDDEDEEDDES